MDTNSISEIGREKLSGPKFAGVEVRSTSSFELLELEISRLSSPTHNASIDWEKVSALCIELLSTKGKDMLVACYLTCSLLETRGFPGFSAGLQVLSDLLETFWDAMYPSVKRLRGRRNALQWLIDRIQQRSAELNWQLLAPQDPELVAKILGSLQSIDAVLLEKDEAAPSVRGLLALVNSFPIEQPKSSEALVVEPPPVQVEPVTLETLSLGSAEQAVRALDNVCGQLANISAFLRSNDNSNPLSYRLNRIAAWAAFEVSPPAENELTSIAPPPPPIVDTFEQLKGVASDAELVQFVEAQLLSFPFWLDLNCVCSCALQRMGSPFDAARREVTNETLELVARLAGLEKLTFIGGMPFADQDTQSWLLGLSHGFAASLPVEVQTGAPEEPLKWVIEAIDNANTLADNGDLVGGVACLQQQLTQVTGGRENLMLRICLCKLMLQHRPRGPLKAFAQCLVDGINRHDLVRWDPALALEALTVAYTVMARHGENMEAASALLERIAGLDANLAVKLMV